jgi:hypothetical protein
VLGAWSSCDVGEGGVFDGLGLAGKGSAGLHRFGRAGKVASRTPSSLAR